MQICTPDRANANQLLKNYNNFLFTILCDTQYNKEEVMVWRIMNFKASLRNCAGAV